MHKTEIERAPFTLGKYEISMSSLKPRGEKGEGKKVGIMEKGVLNVLSMLTDRLSALLSTKVGTLPSP